MLKNIWRRQKGLSLIELLIAVALFAIIMPAFIAFSRTAISNDNNLQNQANATNQLKNAFNYVSQDVQMASLVIINPDPQYTPANCVLELQWLNYPIDAITV